MAASRSGMLTCTLNEEQMRRHPDPHETGLIITYQIDEMKMEWRHLANKGSVCTMSQRPILVSMPVSCFGPLGVKRLSEACDCKQDRGLPARDCRQLGTGRAVTSVTFITLGTSECRLPIQPHAPHRFTHALATDIASTWALVLKLESFILWKRKV